MDKVKLIRLSGEQAAHFWPVLSPGFATSLPPGVVSNSIVLNNMLQSVLNRSMDCWVVKAIRDNEETLVASCLTTVRTDMITSQRTLLIYSLFSKGDTTDDEWAEAFKMLQQAAASSRCHVITAFTKNPRVIQLTQQLGGTTDWHVCELEAKHGS